VENSRTLVQNEILCHNTTHPEVHTNSREICRNAIREGDRTDIWPHFIGESPNLASRVNIVFREYLLDFSHASIFEISLLRWPLRHQPGRSAQFHFIGYARNLSRFPRIHYMTTLIPCCLAQYEEMRVIHSSF